MAIRVTYDTMTLEIDNRVVATARFSEHAAADGTGVRIVSTHPARLFTRDQVITALTVAGLLAVGYVGNDPLVMTLRAGLPGPSSSSGSRPRLPSCSSPA